MLRSHTTCRTCILYPPSCRATARDMCGQWLELFTKGFCSLGWVKLNYRRYVTPEARYRSRSVYCTERFSNCLVSTWSVLSAPNDTRDRSKVCRVCKGVSLVNPVTCGELHCWLRPWTPRPPFDAGTYYKMIAAFSRMHSYSVLSTTCQG